MVLKEGHSIRGKVWFHMDVYLVDLCLKLSQEVNCIVFVYFSTSYALVLEG